MKNRSNYPPNWFDTIRPEILKRDGYKCTQCRVPHRSWVEIITQARFEVLDEHERTHRVKMGCKVKKIHLQVCHLDQNPSNNDYSNLKTMCPRCHLRYDNQYNVIKRMGKKLGFTPAELKKVSIKGSLSLKNNELQ